MGVIKPVCANGYAVTSADVRQVLEVCGDSDAPRLALGLCRTGYIVWSLAFVYILLVCCFFSRIQLAIAVNKVAATFVPPGHQSPKSRPGLVCATKVPYDSHHRCAIGSGHY